jgi:Glycosyltransferase family 28 C-terminal domain
MAKGGGAARVRSDAARKLELVFFEAGGGHRAAAKALEAVLATQYPQWRVKPVNLRELLGPVDFIRRYTGVRAEHFYNGLLKRNLTASIAPILKLMHLLIRQRHPAMVRMLAEHWERTPLDLVVSLIPHFNRALFNGLREADARCNRRETPIVTVMTDLADYPPHFWIERQEQSVICGTNLAVRQALAQGLSSDLIIRSSGMIVRPEFYQRPEFQREGRSRQLGLTPDRPTGLVMFGGFGSKRMELIARTMAGVEHCAQFIFVCGGNRELRARLSAMRLPYPHHIEGFTDDIAGLMRLCDFFIGKPGPGSLSEALVMGLPVIVERNSSTMVHERFNTEWVTQNGFGIVLQSFAEIESAVARVCEPERAAEFKRKIAADRNRAVFELGAIFEDLMAREAAATGRLKVPA